MTHSGHAKRPDLVAASALDCGVDSGSYRPLGHGRVATHRGMNRSLCLMRRQTVDRANYEVVSHICPLWSERACFVGVF